MNRFIPRTMTGLLMVVVLTGSLSKSLFAAPSTLPDGAAPDGTLPSGVAYAQLEETLDGYIEQNKDTMAGMSVSVFAGNDVLLEKSYGYANMADGIANDPDTVFEWSSISTLLIWVSVMQLEEQGKLDLDADIQTYLPDGFLRKLKFEDSITMKNLMNHTAGWQASRLGLGGGTEPIVLPGINPSELKDVLQIIEPAQIFRPGEYTAYSDWGAALAAYIVEEISGVPFYEYVQKNIFSRLGMSHTALYADLSDNMEVRAQREKLAGYVYDGNQLIDTPFEQHAVYPVDMATGTLEDFRIFAQALLPDDNTSSPLFEKSSTLADMHTATSYYADGKTARNCHGFWTLPHLLGDVRGYTRKDPLSTSSLWIDPHSGIGMVVMSNTKATPAYDYKVCPLIFGEKALPEGMDFTDSVGSVYVCTTNIRTGFLKLSSTLSMTLSAQLTRNEDGSLSYVYFNGRMTQIEPGIYKISPDGGGQGLVYAKKDANGYVTALEPPVLDWLGYDIVNVSLATVLFQVVMLLGFFISALYGLVVLLIMLARKLLRKGWQPLGISRACVCAASFSAVVNFFMMTFMTMEGTRTSAPVANCLLFILLALVPVAYLVVLALRMQQLEITKKQRRRLIIPAVMGLLTSANILYWQLWMFWV